MPALLLPGVNAVADSNEIALGCKHLRLVLDARISPDVIAREWATGNERTENPAMLELHDCKGQMAGQMKFEFPLAKLDPTPVRGTTNPTYLVTVDLTAATGSYSGPLTIPIQIEGNRLVPALAHNAAGQTEPIRLAMTGKAAWKKLALGKVDDFLAVSSGPQGKSFVTVYRRYHPSAQGWQVKKRTENGMWESDGQFPALRLFPALP